jgi:hypothetical protein
LECWGQNLGGADHPIGKHSISLASVFASDDYDYEQWLKLDHVGNACTPCGELLVRCQVDRQSPKLDEVLRCYDQSRATNIKIPAGERYLTLMAATTTPGLEATFSFSVRTFDGSPCTIEKINPAAVHPPEKWELQSMSVSVQPDGSGKSKSKSSMTRPRASLGQHQLERELAPVQPTALTDHIGVRSAMKPVRLRGGLAAEKQLEGTKANIIAAARDELYRKARGVDVSRAAVDVELQRVGVDPFCATHTQRRDAKQRLILIMAGPGPDPVPVSEEEALQTVLGKFDDGRVGALTSAQLR